MADAQTESGRIDPDLRRIERCLQGLIDSPVGNRCITCGHVKHNELGYCQNGECACGDGTTVAGAASIIRRDLPRVIRPGVGRPDGAQ